MDVICGVWEVFIFVLFLLYNCIGIFLIVLDCINEVKVYSVILFCYNFVE